MVPFDFQPRTRVIFGPRRARPAGRAGARARRPAHAARRRSRHRAAPATPRRAAGLLEAAGIEVCTFHDFGANPDSAMVEAGRAFAAPLGDRLDRRARRRQLARLRQGHQLPADQRRRDGRLPRLRQGRDAAAADDWRADDRRHRQRGAELRRHRRRRDAHEDGVRRSDGRVPRSPSSTPISPLSAPRHVTAMAGYDAIAHAVETAVTTRRTPLSDAFSHCRPGGC